MQKIHKSIIINSNVQTVWHAVVELEKYKIWTAVFYPGSYFEGNWQEGSKMLFLSQDKDGNKSGLVSKIAKNDMFKYISIEHIGVVENGVEDTGSEKVKAWAPSFENYTFQSKDENETEFVLDMDMLEEWADEMSGMWDKALVELKNLCEKPVKKITIQTNVNKPVQIVWECFTSPQMITQWNFADSGWHCPKAENDLKVGGRFVSVMAAKDGSYAFDFSGTYTKVEQNKLIEYIMDDGRKVVTTFEENGDRTTVVTNFEAELQNPVEMQKQGWQAILDNFKKFCEEK